MLLTIISTTYCFGADIRLSGAFASQLTDKDAFIVVFSDGERITLNNKVYSCNIDKKVDKFILQYQINPVIKAGIIDIVMRFWLRGVFQHSTKTIPNSNIFTQFIDDYIPIETMEIQSSTHNESLPEKFYVMVEGTIHRDGNEPEIELPFKIDRF